MPGKILPPPPRQVIVEQHDTCPAKPPPIYIEKWLPYEHQERPIIHEYLQESPCHRQCSVLSHYQNQSRCNNDHSQSDNTKIEYSQHAHSQHIHPQHDHTHHKHHCCHKQAPQHIIVHSNHSCSCERSHKYHHECLKPIVHNAIIKYAVPQAKLKFPSFARPLLPKLPLFAPLPILPNRMIPNLNVRMNLKNCSSLTWWKNTNWNRF